MIGIDQVRGFFKIAFVKPLETVGSSLVPAYKSFKKRAVLLYYLHPTVTFKQYGTLS